MSNRSPITTHILDIAAGKPAQGVTATLERESSPDQWEHLGTSQTNADGRIEDFLAATAKIESGVYRIKFVTQEYLNEKHGRGFYPLVSITFNVENPAEHYHVPLLLSPHGFSTYRGS